MSSEPRTVERTKRTWHDYLGAFGRANQKASVQLGTSLPLLQHLEELRQRVFKAFAAVILTTALSFLFASQIIDFLAKPLGGKSALVSIEVTENIGIFMKVALLSGLLFGMPFVVYQLLAFILPGLKDKERLWLYLVVPFASILFAAGVAFTWFVMIPTAIPFLVNFLGITTHVRPENYFNFVTSIMFWIGLAFEMPLVVLFLAKLKMVSARQLAGAWRYAVVAIAIVAAAITPTVDPVNMGLVMGPLMGLYLVSIFLAWLVRR